MVRMMISEAGAADESLHDANWPHDANWREHDGAGRWPASGNGVPSSKISDQDDVAVERERVALRRADHAPVLGPVDKGEAAVGSGCHRLRTAFRKRAATADRAIGTRRGPDRNCVLLRVRFNTSSRVTKLS